MILAKFYKMIQSYFFNFIKILLGIDFYKMIMVTQKISMTAKVPEWSKGSS
jgi:hypothetical protein